MRILAIETSCDETAIAIIDGSGGLRSPKFKILSNIVSSQIKIHKKYGGVVPHLAKREHQKNLVPVLKQSLEKTRFLKVNFPANEKNSIFIPNLSRDKIKIKENFNQLKEIFIHEPELFLKLFNFLIKYEFPKFDAIAITVGPGLEPALWTGINFARALSFLFDIPLIPVDHMAAHIYVNWLNKNFSKKPFPALTLLISGGHTQLVLGGKYNDFKIIGETRDDAVGEAFDKVAKLLKLGYPGGPIIEKIAEKGNAAAFNFPRPMIKQKNYEFSFSGLKTAVLYEFKKNDHLKTINYKLKVDMAASFQQAAVDVLVEKTVKAINEFKVKNFLVGGGVSANKKIRTDLEKAVKKQFAGWRKKIKIYFPRPDLATDNALSVAVAGYFNYLKGVKIDWQNARAVPNLRIDYLDF